MHNNLDILTFIYKHLFFFDSHILTRDPSRMVREGLRSIIDPLNKYVVHIVFKKVLGIGIANYCLLPIGLPIGLPVGPMIMYHELWGATWYHDVP